MIVVTVETLGTVIYYLFESNILFSIDSLVLIIVSYYALIIILLRNNWFVMINIQERKNHNIIWLKNKFDITK